MVSKSEFFGVPTSRQLERRCRDCEWWHGEPDDAYGECYLPVMRAEGTGEKWIRFYIKDGTSTLMTATDFFCSNWEGVGVCAPWDHYVAEDGDA